MRPLVSVPDVKSHLNFHHLQTRTGVTGHNLFTDINTVLRMSHYITHTVDVVAKLISPTYKIPITYMYFNNKISRAI